MKRSSLWRAKIKHVFYDELLFKRFLEHFLWAQMDSASDASRAGSFTSPCLWHQTYPTCSNSIGYYCLGSKIVWLYNTIYHSYIYVILHIICIYLILPHIISKLQLHCMSKPPSQNYLWKWSDHHRETSDCLQIDTAKWKFSKNLRFRAGPVPDVLRRAFALATGSHWDLKA